MTIYEFKLLFNGKRFASYIEQEARRDRAYFVKLYGENRVGEIKEVDDKNTSYSFGLGGNKPGMEK